MGSLPRSTPTIPSYDPTAVLRPDEYPAHVGKADAPFRRASTPPRFAEQNCIFARTGQTGLDK